MLEARSRVAIAKWLPCTIVLPILCERGFVDVSRANLAEIRSNEGLIRVSLDMWSPLIGNTVFNRERYEWEEGIIPMIRMRVSRNGGKMTALD